MYKRGFIGLIVRFSGALLNFILTVFMARNMVKEEFGNYQIILTIIVGASMISRAGMDTFFLTRVPGERLKNKINFFFQQSIYLIFQNALAILILTGTSYILYQYLNEGDIDRHVLIFIAVVPQSIYLAHSAFEKASGNTTSSLFISSVCFPFFMLIILWIGQNFTLEYVSKIYLLTSSIVLLISFLITSKRNVNFKLKDLKIKFSLLFLRKGLKYLPHSIITYALLWLDILIIGAMLDGGSWAADYSVASRVTLIILLAMSVYDALISPKIIRSYKENKIDDFANEIKAFFYKTVIFIAFFVLLMYFLSEYILVLFGDDYISALDCVYILIVAYGIKSFSSLPGYVLIAMNRIHIVNKILIGAVIINLIVSAFLIDSHKIIGVAIGTLVASVFIVIFSYIGMFKSLKEIKNAL